MPFPSRRNFLRILSSAAALPVFIKTISPPRADQIDLEIKISINMNQSLFVRIPDDIAQLQAFSSVTIISITNPCFGILQIIPNGLSSLLIYEPNVGFVGSDEILITLSVNNTRYNMLLSLTITDNTGQEIPPPNRVFTVGTNSALSQVISQVKTGDHIVLLDGIYSANVTLKTSSVVIRAANPLQATIKAPWTLSANNGIFYQLHFSGVGISVNNCTQPKISRCIISDLPYTPTAAMMAISSCSNMTIEYCEFARCGKWGVRISGDPSSPAIGTHVIGNYFHDWLGNPQNEHEPIQFGETKTNTDISLRTIFEYNLMVNCGVDSEAISIKSSDNVVRFNTMLNCNAHLSNRHGKRNKIMANILNATYGLRVQDQNNQILGNYLISSKDGLNVMAGDVPALKWPAQGTHPAGYNNLLSGNNADKTIIGYTFPGQIYPAIGTTIEHHTGPIVMNLQQGTIDHRSWPASVVIPSPILLSQKDVGPAAKRRTVPPI